MARIRKESLSMAKSCRNCAHAKDLSFGERTLPFCTKNPPTVEVQRTQEGGLVVNSWYPPIPTAPCGEHRRRWFGALKAPSPQ